MKTSLTTLILVSLTTLTLSRLLRRTHTKPAPPNQGGTLVVDVDFGSIDVTPGDSDKVVIDARRKIEASSKEKEEEYFKAVPVTITTEGDKVIVRAIHKNESFGAQFWHLLGRTRTEARYTFKVPASFSVNLDTAGGSISPTV
jgi:hypothetical protein